VSYDVGGNWESELMDVTNSYIEAVFNFIMHKAHSKDADFPGDEAKSKYYYALWLQGCGVQVAQEQ
jgi:hypothetical protein